MPAAGHLSEHDREFIRSLFAEMQHHITKGYSAMSDQLAELETTLTAANAALKIAVQAAVDRMNTLSAQLATAAQQIAVTGVTPEQLQPLTNLAADIAAETATLNVALGIAPAPAGVPSELDTSPMSGGNDTTTAPTGGDDTTTAPADDVIVTAPAAADSIPAAIAPDVSPNAQ